MPPALRQLIGLLLWSTAIGALVPAAYMVFRRQFDWNVLGTIFLHSSIYANLCGVTFTFGTQLIWPYTTRLHPFGALLVRGASFVLFATIASVAGAAIISPMIGAPFAEVFWPGYRITLFIAMTAGAGLASYEGVKHQLAATQLQLKQRELEHERAVKLAAEARLASLESRLHPHFLFNAINSVSSLIVEDPKRAERLLGQVADLLRFSLDAGHTSLVPLERELQIVENYLEIEKARFADRLRYTIERLGDLSGIQVPPLSLQTLAENAVKHVVGSRREPTNLRVTAAVVDGRVNLDVVDDGPGFDLATLPAGHGLDNLSQRLEVLYPGGNARIHFRRTNGLFTAGYTIPQGRSQQDSAA